MLRRALVLGGGAIGAISSIASAKHAPLPAERSATEQLFRLDGRLAWVTGASRGLGLEMACGLAECGAHVVLSGREEKTLLQARDAIKARHPAAECTVLPFDTLDDAQVAGALPRLIEATGRSPDILVNNAGMVHRAEVSELGTEDFNVVMQCNVIAPFVLSRECSKAMRERGWGRIINIGSIMSEHGTSRATAYCTSKHAVAGLTRSMASELAVDGVTVNAICPGFFHTEMTRARSQDPKMLALISSRNPAGRWGDPREVVGPVVFLASDAASHVNGAMLVVDGGTTATFHVGAATSDS